MKQNINHISTRVNALGHKWPFRTLTRQWLQWVEREYNDLMGWISASCQKAELEQRLLPGELSSLSASRGPWQSRHSEHNFVSRYVGSFGF